MPRGGHRENAGRKAGWNNPETQTIRVPKALAGQLLEIARKLDEGQFIDFDTKSKDSIVISKNELENISQIVVADVVVTRNGKDKGSVKKAVEAIIKLLVK